MAARHEEGSHENKILTDFLVWKGLSNDDVGVARITAGIIRAGFKTGDFVKVKLGWLS